MSGRLVILSSPSGTGKTTIARRILDRRGNVRFSVSATTRARRQRERDGVDYHFLSREEFLGRRDAGEFLEWAEYNGQLYGTLRSEVDASLAEGNHVFLDIDVQGAEQVRARRDDVVAIFVLPPSGVALLRRLRGRGSESREQVARRLARARQELEYATAYDFVVVNDVLEDTVAAVERIIDGEVLPPLDRRELDERIERLRREFAELDTQKES